MTRFRLLPSMTLCRILDCGTDPPRIVASFRSFEEAAVEAARLEGLGTCTGSAFTAAADLGRVRGPR